jgi:hypothetical protein
MNPVKACRISPSKTERLTESYTALHEGLPPSEFICEPWRATKVKAVLGRATEIQYRKKIPDDVPSYHHPWAEQARPSIGIDDDGHIKFAAGRYETTRRGIEDRIRPGTNSPETIEYLKRPYVQKEHWVPVPNKSLNTLGTLEFVRYVSQDTSGRWIQKDLVFPQSNAPVIAHDQAGNLHALHGRYRISERGVENPMAFAVRSHRGYDDNPGYDNPRHGRRSFYGRRSRRRYSNPIATMSDRGGTTGQRAGRMVLNTLILASVGGGEIILVGYGLKRVSWSTPIRAGFKIALGLGGGLGLGYALPQVPQVAAGFAVGGVLDGLIDLWNAYIAPRLAGTTAAATAPVTTPAVTTTPAPSGQTLMPGGIPRQYAGYSPAACGVA